MPVARYHTALVVLHWLLAVMLIVALGMGAIVLDKTPNSSPEKIDALRGHMIAGMAILALMVVRLIVRLKTAHPPAASSGMAWADRLAPWVHRAIYLLVIVQALSGFGTSLMAGLPAIVFGGVGSLPPDFHAYWPRAVHGIASKLLMTLIALHISAAMFHQLVVGDGLMARMGFGKR
jgi:cytochrome b561